MSMKEKIKLLELLKEDLGDNQFRSTVIRVVTTSIINQWIENRYVHSQSLNRTEIVERINLTLINHGIKPVSYSYIKQLSND